MLRFAFNVLRPPGISGVNYLFPRCFSYRHTDCVLYYRDALRFSTFPDLCVPYVQWRLLSRLYIKS